MDSASEDLNSSEEDSENNLTLNKTSNEINNLLLEGEDETFETQSESDDNESNKQEDENANYKIPESGIDVHLPSSNFMFGGKKKKDKKDIKIVLKNKINHRIRICQVLIHKTGLLLWLAHGFYLNSLVNDADLQAFILSIIPNENFTKKPNLKYFEKLTKWFSGFFNLSKKSHNEVIFNREMLLKRIEERNIYNYVELVLLYIAGMRALGFTCRLAISFNPPHLKPKPDQLFKLKNDEEDKDNEDLEKNKVKKASKYNFRTNTKKPEKIFTREKREDSSNKRKCSSRSKSLKCKDPNSSDEEFTQTSTSPDEEDNTQFSTDEEFVVKKPFKKRITAKTILKNDNRSKSPKKKKNSKPEKLLSSTTEPEEEEIQEQEIEFGENVWPELYVESEKKWMCIDIMNIKFDCPKLLFEKASKPLYYVVVWNRSGRLKDVTRRYSPDWLSVTRKTRVDNEWWTETTNLWAQYNTARSKAEDEQLLQKELQQPLPKTVGECKSHPLYALARHLLKYEAIYPPNPVPLGHLKNGEAIYSRFCVYTLYSRETWLKRARVVKPAQEAYKIVKAFPKYDKLTGQWQRDLPLELFGEWQTDPYVPAEAKDGIVPRNEYGNIDLFQSCMLPGGTVHMDLPGLNRVARKLNIDCAPAVVGFNFGCRGARPAFQGYVVCKEHEKTLKKAWEKAQKEAEKRQEQKREQRIWTNWKKLIRGLLIKEKIAARYNVDQESKNEEPYENKAEQGEDGKDKVGKKGNKTVASRLLKTNRKIKSNVKSNGEDGSSSGNEFVEIPTKKAKTIVKENKKKLISLNRKKDNSNSFSDDEDEELYTAKSEVATQKKVVAKKQKENKYVKTNLNQGSSEKINKTIKKTTSKLDEKKEILTRSKTMNVRK